ncbi:MAG: comEA 2 [Holophagaceae bacterium]|nr:comEA 2 [Holophagaceae bacterium]
MLTKLGLAILTTILPLSAGERAPQAPVNLNTAGVTELMQLPKVGAKTAERIVAYRKQHGGFKRTEELMNVKGIGEKSFAKLRPHLSVGTKAATKP